MYLGLNMCHPYVRYAFCSTHGLRFSQPTQIISLFIEMEIPAPRSKHSTTSAQ